MNHDGSMGHAPQQQPAWIPSRDYLVRWPLIQTWPGLRTEIKATWEALAKAANGPRVVATWGEWQDFLGVASSTLRARLQTLGRIGLLRWSHGEDGSRRVVVELIDPLGLERTPVGPALRVRRPRLTAGCFDRQESLFDGPRLLRLAGDGSAEMGVDEAERVQLDGHEAEQLDGHEAERVQLDGHEAEQLHAQFPTASAPQWVLTAGACAGAPVRSDLNDLNEMIIESKEGDAPAKPADGGGGSSQGPPVDPVEALTTEDFERRREEVAEKANAIACRLWRVDQRARIGREDKAFIAKIVFLASAKPCAPYGANWLDDAVDRVARSKSRKTLDKPAGYLHQVLRKSLEAAGRDFPTDLAVIESIISRDLFSAQPRASPPAAKDLAAKDSPQPGPQPGSPAPYDLPWVPPTPEKLAEALANTAAARAAIQAARAAKESSQSLIPNPSKDPCPKPTDNS